MILDGARVRESSEWDDFIILSLALIWKEVLKIEREICKLLWIYCQLENNKRTKKNRKEKKKKRKNIMFSIRSRSLNIMKTISGVRLESSSNKMFPDENWLVKNRFLAARGWVLLRMAALDRYCDKVNAMKPPQTNKEGWQRMTDMNLLRYNSLKAVANARGGVNYMKGLNVYKSARYNVILGLDKFGNSLTDFLERKFKWNVREILIYFWIIFYFNDFLVFEGFFHFF